VGSTVPHTTTTVQHTLPFTGSSGTPPLFGLVSLLGGFVLLVVSRRRHLRRL
jgi:LPXTG-motif cell wall-anchored protein